MDKEVLTQRHGTFTITGQPANGLYLLMSPRPSNPLFRFLTNTSRTVSEEWTDSALLAFAQSAGFQLVDRGYTGK
jgi:hypothetical protein